MRALLLLLLLGFCSSLAMAQHTPTSFTVKQIQERITIDGVLDEAVWSKENMMTGYWQYFPRDSVRAKHQTELWMAYDEQNLYIAARCYTIGKKHVIPSLRRDYRAGGSDNISFLFDTFSDRTNAFLFGMNPYGVQREATIMNGGQTPDPQYFSTSWDNKWYGNSKIYDTYWTCEVAIPFKTLRYKQGSEQWNFNSYRFEMQANEQSTFTRIPQNQEIFNLAFLTPMRWEKPLGKPGANVSIIPYINAGSSKDFEGTNINAGDKIKVGADVKVGITPGLNLDLTVNPDFSQVEADRQVQNLTRFDISFPEQRQFFLENADLFSSFGTPEINPFFSRQIGIAKDTVTGLYTQNALNYGARLSGKLDNNWRIGLLNTQTAKDATKGITGANFTIAALQRKLFARSNVSFIFVNKQTLNQDINPKATPYNRIAGVEYNLASADNKWFGKFFYHQAITPLATNDKLAYGTSLNYNVRKFTVGWAQQLVGNGYDAEVGFVPRKNYWRIKPIAFWKFYPNNKVLNRHGMGVSYEQINVPNLGMTDQTLAAVWNVSFQDTGEAIFSLNHNYTYLFAAFDPTRSKNPALPMGSSYRYNNFQFFYMSNRRKKLSITTQGVIGQYFDGSIISADNAIVYRYQPYGLLTLNYTYSHIRSSQGVGDLHLIGPRVDLTFTKSLFWTTYFQYNNLINNVNINSRLQWRFKPVSDVFLLYTDNYNSTNWNVKNRAIVLKVTYWLNV
ncbi:MAG: DUF5916 domain-containing protein [Spirosomataceae bacterium]